jgi:NTP pyrophosphatase (non-canonical NTP hydrolase)
MLHDYTLKAVRTAATPTSFCNERELNIVHFLLGIQTETNELVFECKEKWQLKEELGDLFWYCALAATTLGFTLNDLTIIPIETEDPEEELQKISGTCTDMAKRIIFYRKEYEDHHIAALIGEILSLLEQLINLYDLEIEDVLECNINKLQARYPDKYTDHHALNRNLSKEKGQLQ